MATPQEDFTKTIPERIANRPEQAQAVDAIFLIRVTGEGGGTWTVNLKDNPGVTEGESEEADCTIELDTDAWQALSENPNDAMGMFFQGKLKVSGNMMLATKLPQILA